MYYSTPPDNSTKPSEMTKHFTTPEFADLLNQHGIEVDTPFYYADGDLCLLHGEGHSSYFYIIGGNECHAVEVWVDIKPAYLLSEVLTWLPEKLVILDNLHFRQLNFHNGQITVGYIRHGSYTTSGTIEKVVTELLTEGWLTKEIIEQSIKHNQ